MTPAELAARPWWRGAVGLRDLGLDVMVFDPLGRHHTEWDHQDGHGNITVVPIIGASTWKMFVTGPRGALEREEAIADALASPVRW